MGQYYIIILLESTQSNKILAWLYPNGCVKLGEHGYLGDDPVEKVESYLIPGASFYKRPLVWAGDYADEEETDPKGRTLYSIAQEDYGNRGLDLSPLRFVRLSEEERVRFKRARKTMTLSLEGYIYVVNHTLREYVNKYLEEEKEEVEEDGKRKGRGWAMHPLAVLCNEGNGRGWGGDYQGTHMDKVGRWARHVISLEKEPPEGFTELKCKFIC